MRRQYACFAMASTLALAASAPAVSLDPSHALPSLARPGVDMPAIRTHHYRMAGRVRPLLFWVGRDNVGLARIVWRGNEEARGYDFVVGTDPAVAPRAINRWGYITEAVRGGGGRLFALMSRADEVSYDEARANTEQGGATVEYRGIEALLDDGTATWRVARVAAAREATIHDVDPLVAQVRQATANAPAQTMRVPRETRPGFLVAVAELVARSVERAAGPQGRVERPPEVVPYIFGRGRYELRLRELAEVGVPAAWQGRAGRAGRAEFEIRTLATGARTRFEMTYALTGELAGVPFEISWQPRWWLKLELHLRAA